MILDFVARSNNIAYNIKLAKIFGVYSSIYLTLLIDCYFSKEDDFIKLSRDDIYNLTGIEADKQLEIEDNLKTYNLVEINPLKNSSSKNYYKLNAELIEHVISLKDVNIEAELQKTIKTFKVATKPPKALSKRACIMTNLKNAIKTTDSECKQCLEEWVDNVMQKGGYLSKQQVEYVEDELTKYSNSYKVPLINLFKLAARLGYKEPKWIIQKYTELNITNNSLVLNDLNQEDVKANLDQLKNYSGETF